MDSDSRIAGVRARVHRAPVHIPLIDEPIEQRHFVTCEVETAGGHTGFGLTGHFLARGVQTTLAHDFPPVVEGMDLRRTEALHDRLGRALNPRTQNGVYTSALSAFDIAVWDALGKASGEPIATLLGGHRDHTETYVTFGFPEYGRDQLVEAALAHTKAGHTRLKLVVAVDPGGVREDARRVKAVREAVGEDVDLMLDANYMFSPVEALNLCRLVEDCNIAWFEEPLHQNDARALHDLRMRTSIPLSAGQQDGHRWRLRELVQWQAVDILQPNVCYTGGYTESRKIAHLAQAYNLPVANGGGWPHPNMHFFAAMANGWRTELHLGMKYVGDRIFPDAPQAQGDTLPLPDGPGLGMRIDWDWLDETVVVA